MGSRRTKLLGMFNCLILIITAILILSVPLGNVTLFIVKCCRIWVGHAPFRFINRDDRSDFSERNLSVSVVFVSGEFAVR